MIQNKEQSTIQHACGFKYATEDNMRGLSEQVDIAFKRFFAKRGLPVPEIDRYAVCTTSERNRITNSI